MLKEIKIENLAIIERALLRWENGFSVISGETGAGKSILINALKLILGERGSPDLIRPGADSTRVEAQFNISQCPVTQHILEREKLSGEGGELILERRLVQGGKSRCRVNGSLVTSSILSEIAGSLIDLHGQHQQQGLLNSKTHLKLLDRFGKLESLRSDYSQAYSQWKTKERELHGLRGEKEAIEKQRDFLLFQSSELEGARLRPGEEEELAGQLKILSQSEKIRENIFLAEELLEGSEGMLGQLGRLEKIVSEIHQSTSSFGGAISSLGDIKITLKQLLEEIRSYRVPDAEDLSSVDAMNARLAFLQGLKTKYKKSIEELITLRDKCMTQINRLDNFALSEEDLLKEVEAGLCLVSDRGKTLGQKRKQAAGKFEKSVNSRFSFLGMENSVLGCSWTAYNNGEEPGPDGFEEMAFCFLPNPGSDLRPLQSVISGGEASRVMLAIKYVLAAVDQTPLLVFDEIDTGIGGHTANRVGETLEELARHHQVIVITHLPQVAARASRQYSVSKSVSRGQTHVEVKTLTEAERIGELARMMGNAASETTREHARELLTRGQQAADLT